MDVQIEPARSKHALIAETLSSDISSGKYKVGDLLPTEAQLSATFGVSRHTVRIALGRLQSLGLIEGQRGIGTQVRKRQVASRYSHSFSSAADLLQYGSSTRQRIVDQSQFAVNAEQAAYLACKAGERWWRLRILRVAPRGKTPVVYSEIDIPVAFGAVIGDVAKSKQPIFWLMEKRFHEPVIEIRQDISAVTVSRDEAGFLDVAPGSAGLEISRRFIGRRGRTLGAARSVHLPKSSFKYSMDIHLEQHAIG